MNIVLSSALIPFLSDMVPPKRINSGLHVMIYQLLREVTRAD